MSSEQTLAEILKRFHVKHTNRFHQFLMGEAVNTCPVCNIDLGQLKKEMRIMESVDNGKKRIQWNSETKIVIVQALGGKCVRCGETNLPVLEIDHIIPLSWGGTNDLGNLQVLCSNCHIERHKGSTKDNVVCNDPEPSLHGDEIALDMAIPEVLVPKIKAIWEKHIKTNQHPTMMITVRQDGVVIGVREKSDIDRQIRANLKRIEEIKQELRARGEPVEDEVCTKESVLYPEWLEISTIELQKVVLQAQRFMGGKA